MKPVIGKVVEMLLEDRHHPIIHSKTPFEDIIHEIKRKLPPETETLEFHKDDISYAG
jgi:hypothetical protein